MNYLIRWQGSTDPANLAGTATFTAGGQSVSVGMCSFEDARALDKEVMVAAAEQAKQAQATYLRGALGRLSEELDA